MVHIRFWGVVSVSLMSMSLAFVFILYRALLDRIVSPVSVVVCILRPATGILFSRKVLLGKLGICWGGRGRRLISRMSRSVNRPRVNLRVALNRTPLLVWFSLLFISIRVLFSLVVVSWL